MAKKMTEYFTVTESYKSNETGTLLPNKKNSCEYNASLEDIHR